MQGIAQHGSWRPSCTSTTWQFGPSAGGTDWPRFCLSASLDAAIAEGATRATLEVRRSNHAARALYEGLGFRVRGVRRDYYTDPVEDGLILWREPAQTASPSTDKRLEGT